MRHTQTPYSEKKMEKVGKIPAPGAKPPERFCPLPMLGAGMKEPSKVIGAQEQTITAIPCMGERCMWHINVGMPTEKAGEVQVVGQCAIAAQAQALFGITNASGAIATKLVDGK